MRCYLHTERNPDLHAETVEAVEKGRIEVLLKSPAVKENPERYCKHGAYRGDTVWAKSCCLCQPVKGKRCYE